MKVAHKLFLGVGLFMTIALIGLGSYTAATAKSFLYKAARDNLHAQTLDVVAQLEQIVSTTTADMQVVMAHKAFEDFLTFLDFGDSEGVSKEIDNIESFLARVYKAKPNYAMFQLFGHDKPLLQLIGGIRKEKIESSDRAAGMTLLKRSIESAGSRIVHRNSSRDGAMGMETLAALGSGKKIEGMLATYQSLDDVLKRLVATAASHNVHLLISDVEKMRVAASARMEPFAADLSRDRPIPGWVTEAATVPGLDLSIHVGIEEAIAFGVVRQMIFGTAIAITVTLLMTAFFLPLITRSIVTKPLTRVSEGLWRIARGEATVTTQLEITTNDEIGNLAKAFNEIAKVIHQALSKVVRTTGSLSEQTKKLLDIATKVSAGASQQRDRVNGLSTSMTEAAASAGSVAEVTSKAANAAMQAKSEGSAICTTIESSLAIFTRLADDVSRETDVINQLARDSEGINQILQSIRGIAEQTNLLALNAAIEAARAGDHGRGFAVVADEVRELAGRTQNATVEIETMIKKILIQAKNAAQTMDTTRENAEQSRRSVATTGTSVKMIIQGIEEITDLNTQVATATEEQGAVAQEVNGHLSAIAHIAVAAADGAEEMRAATDMLANLSTELTQAVGQFKL